MEIIVMQMTNKVQAVIPESMYVSFFRFKQGQLSLS